MKRTIETKCGTCERVTHHQQLYIRRKKIEDEYVNAYTDYMMLECGGCKTISFLIRVPDYNVLPDEPQFTDYNYPLQPDLLGTTYNFLQEQDQEELPQKIYFLYEEVKTTFRTDSNIMAGIGLRMLVESICLHQKIAGRNLQEKINKLHTSGMISTAELPILDKLRQIGNQSSHKIKAFPIDKLSYALDIVNHILKSIYILPKINRRLRM